MMRTIAAALALLSTSAMAGAAAPSAVAYVTTVYRTMPRSGSFRQVAYAGALGRLMARDRREAEAEGIDGALEADPFCDCQDFASDYRIVDVRETHAAGDRATVVIDIRNDGPARFTLDLVRAHGRWLVADLHSATIPSLLAYLRRALHP